MKNFEHCSNCGDATECTPSNEGYSECCNKRICDGDAGYQWKVGPRSLLDTPERFTVEGRIETACCFPVAEALIEADEAIYCRADWA